MVKKKRSIIVFWGVFVKMSPHLTDLHREQPVSECLAQGAGRMYCRRVGDLT